MKKTRNRLISVGIALLLFIAAAVLIIPTTTASAASFSGGDGSSGNPYRISTAADLAAIAQQVNNSGIAHYDGVYFKLYKDINLGGMEWAPIGKNDSTYWFNGNFDGDGHTISNLTITQKTDGGFLGLFGCSRGTIKNLFIKNVNINAAYGEKTAGAICAANYGTIEKCGVDSGTIVDKSSGIGGISGRNYDTISQCYNKADLTTENGKAAGISGMNYQGTIENCYNAGTITQTGTNENYLAGGICSDNNGGIVKYCLNFGKVISANGVGYGVSKDNGTVTECYYDEDVCGNLNGDGTAMTSAELCDSSFTDSLNSNWESGSESGETNGRYRTAIYTYPSLKGVGTAVKTDGKQQYDFSISGNGKTYEDFTYIETAEDFKNIANNLSGNYVLKNDIDFKGEVIEPIGDSESVTGSGLSMPFSGNFSGNGHTVTMTDDSTCGLFGTNKGTIINLAVKGSIDSSVGSSTDNYSGGICAVNDGTIYGCSFEGKIYGGANNTGAVCGLNNKTISNCFALANVEATNGLVGGIAALGKEGSELKSCYFVGTALDNSTVGLISLSPSENCYYNNEVCQFDEEESGTGLTTLQMTSYGALAKMKFTDDIWEKRLNDTENGIAYYPSFKGSTYVPSVKYDKKLELNRVGDKEPVYGDDIEFTTNALITFENDFYGNDITIEDPNGSFKVLVGDETEPLILLGKTFKHRADTAGDVKFKLIYNGSGYFPENYSESFVVKIGKKALTAADFDVTLPADRTFDNTAKAASVTAKSSGVGKITVKYYDESGNLLTSSPVSAGTYTFKIDAADGGNYNAAKDLTADTWKFTIEKAAAKTLPDTEVSYRWSTDKDITVAIAGLPENMGQVTVNGANKAGTIVAGIIPGSCYSDGKLTFHLGPNTADDIGKTGSFTITLASDNYESVTFAVKITLTAKDNQDAPDPTAFDVVFTNDGSKLTATIKTKLKGVEYSFDGKTWSNVNTTAVAHLKDVTAYLRYKETDELNASAAVFKTVNSGHGKLVHHAAVQATCQNTGNVEYWECETCAKYYSDEAAATEVSLAEVIIAKTDHKWSVKYTYDKNGHWHKCEYCDAVTETESHVSSGEATSAKAEYCTVCGYIITPRKGGGSSGGHVSGGSHSRDNTTERNPSINGEQKTWSDIAADLGRQNGGSATISMNGETTVPAEVIKAIADRKIKVEFVYDSTKSWLIDGAKITTVSAADLSLFHGSVDTSSLRGILGCKYRISADIPAEIRFTFLKRYAGEFANVYKLVDGKLVFQTCVKLAEDGTAVIPGMSAPGEYAVMVCRYSDRQGDFDNNGILDIYDAVALLRYSVGLDSGENLQLIDLNGDGLVNCADASTVLRWLVGLSA